ncbi:MAG: nicotinate-nucleotide adenylyltransferase [Acidimicrobiales bacterium]
MTGTRIGIFGGTFDPPHVGHLATAVNVTHDLGLDRMLMVVANVPWQKVGTRQISPAADRLAMVEAAVAASPLLDASSIELERGGETYTADTLAELSGQDPDAELFLIVGADAAAGLDTWKRPDEIRSQCTIVVVDRPGRGTGRPPEGWEHVHVDVPQLEISSSDLRVRFRDGRPTDYLVPPEVLAVIAARDIYGGAG